MSSAAKKRKYIEALAAIEVLETRWPKTFFLNQMHRKPLKVGIHDDLLAAGVELTPSALSNALRTYCGNRFYLQQLRVGAGRIDLEGAIVGYVNSVDAKCASDELRRRRYLKAVQQEAAAATSPVHGSPAPMSERPPRRLSLADLRAAARERKAATA